MDRSKLKTWGRNRSVRLPDFDYASHVPYHVVIRTLAGAPFLDQNLAMRCCEILLQHAEATSTYIGCYCLMPDHLHVLISPDLSGRTLGFFVGGYKSLTTRESWSVGHSGRLWQPRFYDHIVRRHEDVATVARYIYENSDRKELGDDYPFRGIADAFG